ncbi:MAG: peptide chain release factor N(5)-glutamine methyltransferase [Clostridia bacterium]|nr:peptide chain release factor N(5)-glutamine methyltransferase [Clostridia bacterium]
MKAALSGAGIEEASDEAALLIERFAGVDRATLICDRRREYDAPDLDEAVRERLSHRPLQYILGEWYFFGLPFRVTEDCLIPRPDTEVLVEQALAVIPPDARVADLCTGSGCIAVSVLHSRPDVTCHALELFPDTLRLAAANAESNGVADRFVPVRADLLDDGPDALRTSLLQRTPDAPPLFDVILSNPPYIPCAEVDGLAPELAFEPRAALDGGEDGLTFYRAILRDYRTLLRDGGTLLLEIGADQAADLERLSTFFPGWTDFSCLRDLGGHDRVVVLRAAQT